MESKKEGFRDRLTHFNNSVVNGLNSNINFEKC